MPATSKKQFRFMEAVKHGGIKKPGLSPEKASEFVDHTAYKSLPTVAENHPWTKLKSKLGK